MTRQYLRIVVIAPLRYPITQPFAGGLESSIWNQIRCLRQLGHTVTLCALKGSDYLQDGPPAFTLPELVWPDPSIASDITYPPGFLTQAFAALNDALGWIATHRADFDIIENHCLHGLPLEWTDRIGLPMVTNLHTPTLPDLTTVHQNTSGTRSNFVSVSSHTAAEWELAGVESTVVPNAVDPDLWPLGEGGSNLVWFGRIVEEKAPHLAVQAASRLGRKIVLAGRVGDEHYAATHLWPLLGPDVEYRGPLRQADLAALVGSSACALITPLWDEPFGLVIAESLMTGTPVAAFDVGGIPEVVCGIAAAMVLPRGDIDALASAVDELMRNASSVPARRQTRSAAVQRFSILTRVQKLVALYTRQVQEFHSMVSAG